MMPEKTVVAQLEKIHLFRNVDRNDVIRLVKMCEIRHFMPRNVIYPQGAPAENAMILVSGKLDVNIVTGSTERHLGDIHPGEIFGEQGLFHSGGVRSAQVVANKESVCLLITPELMRDTWNNQAIVALEQYLIATMARRIRTTNLEIQKIWKSEEKKEETPEKTTNTVVETPTENSGGLLGRLRSLFGGK